MPYRVLESRPAAGQYRVDDIEAGGMRDAGPYAEIGSPVREPPEIRPEDDEEHDSKPEGGHAGPTNGEHACELIGHSVAPSGGERAEPNPQSDCPEGGSGAQLERCGNPRAEHVDDR